ncbi:MAG TPA: hypothetical protein VII49_09245 [Rhizomicrobium sp.]
MSAAGIHNRPPGPVFFRAHSLFESLAAAPPVCANALLLLGKSLARRVAGSRNR